MVKNRPPEYYLANIENIQFSNKKFSSSGVQKPLKKTGRNPKSHTSVTFNTANGAYKYAYAKHVEHKITVLTKTRPNWVKAQFYGGGISYSTSLTW
jgi:hypothetical protein